MIGDLWVFAFGRNRTPSLPPAIAIVSRLRSKASRSMISAGVSISESGAPIWVGGRDIENQPIVFGLAPRICWQPFYGNNGRRTSAGGFDARLQRSTSNVRGVVAPRLRSLICSRQTQDSCGEQPLCCKYDFWNIGILSLFCPTGQRVRQAPCVR